MFSKVKGTSLVEQVVCFVIKAPLAHDTGGARFHAKVDHVGEVFLFCLVELFILLRTFEADLVLCFRLWGLKRAR